MITYQCWFCGEEIAPTDHLALRVSVTSLWHDVDELQQVYAHSNCARTRMAGSGMELESDMFEEIIADHIKGEFGISH